ncbi:aldehyde dehydrogenase family protein [Halalkalibacter krulwichiae]|uniref:NADP-dependent glyceraldehyde-3-phosphate dehydrogenase n=1 Tax=Halalkalibacter krulwichiae TaxID=199441 RepID=A0A1X9MFU6_9BACI|nr:aldehyde dehydrogenase family protein [Halalkalibacter krulwichiae]ARK30391.1 NADP-dependent glyceraldehyde-3-phosphate dehydrogenase [Halalkalibacter krulwichiae]
MAKQIVKERMLIGGRWIAKKDSIDVYDPATSDLIATVPAASTEDVIYAISRAKEGFKRSSSLSVFERTKILQSAASYIEENADIYIQTIVLESSKTVKEARKEVRRCIETLRLSAEEAKRIEGETVAFSQMPGHEKRVGYVYRFPIGIVAAITPFNDPLNLVAHKIGPAIAAGNAVIVKPASLTPLSAIRLAEAFIHAGLPDGVLSVVTGRGEAICNPLVEHEDVRFVSFTGGYETGKEITSKAGVKKLAMELGSNSPTIVLADANIKEAVAATVEGAFGVAGQNCIGVQRIFVEESKYDDFLDRYVLATRKLKIGLKTDELTDIGPMISEKEAKRVEKWIDEAANMGATICCGGKRSKAFLEPTVLTNVPETSTISQNEVFGPVVIIEPVQSLSEAINRSNQTEYGLQAGIFTTNLEDAFTAVHQLQFGGVMINDSSDVRIDSMPFGGIKGSGIGREGVRYAIEAMTEQKVVAFKLKRSPFS